MRSRPRDRCRGELLGLQILVSDLDHGVLFDVVADLLAPLDLLSEPRQALGVEGIGRVEELHGGLVELGQRRRFELKTILQQVGGNSLADTANVLAALLVQLFHGHRGRHRAQCVYELALHQLFE